MDETLLVGGDQIGRVPGEVGVSVEVAGPSRMVTAGVPELCIRGEPGKSDVVFEDGEHGFCAFGGHEGVGDVWDERGLSGADEFEEVGRGGPEACCCLFGENVPGTFGGDGSVVVDTGYVLLVGWEGIVEGAGHVEGFEDVF